MIVATHEKKHQFESAEVRVRFTTLTINGQKIELSMLPHDPTIMIYIDEEENSLVESISHN